MSPLIPFRPPADCDDCSLCEVCDVNTCDTHGNGDRTTCTHRALCGECALRGGVACSECRWDAAS